MPAVDRAVLRLGAWELLHNNEVPPAVAISESVELVQELSTEASGGFVHGVLRTIGENTGTGEALPRQ
jgi:N utilization substance protein B